MYTTSQIGARVQEARKAAHMTQAQLAAAVGCHPHTISLWERGDVGINVELLQTFARILGRPVSWFLGQDTAPVRQPVQSMVRELVARYEALEIVEVPLLGSVPAGEPMLPEDQAQDLVSLPRSLVQGIARPFALRISGTSLEDIGVHDGDTVIVDPDAPVVDGRVYVVRIGAEVTAKRLYREQDRLRLGGERRGAGHPQAVHPGRGRLEQPGDD